MKKLAILAMILAALVVVVPASATTISDLQRKQRELRAEQERIRREREAEQRLLDELSGEISGMEEDADAIAVAINELDDSLVVIIASVDMISEDIAEKEEVIILTTIMYEEAKAHEEAQYEGMMLRLKHMYETADISYLQILFESNSISDMLNRIEYMEKLNRYDKIKLDAFIAAKEETAAIRNLLEDEKAALEAQQRELEEEMQVLEMILEEKRNLYDNYEVLIAQARQQAAVYSANVRNQNNVIRELARQEAQVREQEIAAVRAAEEARRAAEEAARRASGTAGSSSGGNFLPASSFTSGSKGERIAAYACQFVGNPYVAGGTSLTQGADCSGFVWRVFRDFGITTPRTSWSIREAGTGVEYSNAKPGDVICYAGHVGIFIGNGRIVHASTQRTGIIITPATYKTILAVRRFV